MTPSDLIAATGCDTMRAAIWAPALTGPMSAGAINTPPRKAAFLAEVAHESGRFVFVREIWGPTPAQAQYGERADLGNTDPRARAAADARGVEVGRFFCGRGLLQVTGFANYASCSARLFADDRLVHHPELLEQPDNAVLSAVHFWSAHNLNAFADLGDLTTITKRINGGLNGFPDRLALFRRANAFFGETVS